MDNNLNEYEKLKLHNVANGIEGTGMPMFMGDKEDLDTMVKNEAKTKINDKITEYVNKLDKHNALLEEYRKNISMDLEQLEIKPNYEGVLIKPYEQNPFQQIKKEGNIITDTGGLIPQYKSNETGEWEEEEAFVRVGLVIDVGPTCKYIKEGDVVFWRKPSECVIPFFKQGFVQVNEHSIMTIVNQGLTERFKTND